MAKQPKRIRLTSDVALALRDAEADGTPVELDANGKTYDVVPRPDTRPERGIWTGYDPAKFLAAFRAAKGAFNTIDTAELLWDIHTQRGQDTPGRPA